MEGGRVLFWHIRSIIICLEISFKDSKGPNPPLRKPRGGDQACEALPGLPGDGHTDARATSAPVAADVQAIGAEVARVDAVAFG